MTLGASIRHFLFSEDSWLWRPNRPLLYWITTVALILSIGQVIWDALDINLKYQFSYKPSSGWTGGVANDTRVYAIANADLMAPDLQTRMPPGVRVYGSLPVYVDVDRSSLQYKILSRLSTVPLDLLILAVVWLFRRTALSAVGTPEEPANPFVWANVRRLRIIATLIILAPVVNLWSGIAELVLANQSLKEFSVIEWDTNLLVLGAAMGIILAVVAEVFAVGIRLQKDVEGLV